MKFDWRLDFSENMQRWQAHYENAGPCHYTELSSEEQSRLLQLNDRLAKCEAKFIPELRLRHETFSRRVQEPDDWLQDFNLDLWVHFILDENDQEWEEEGENILMSLCCSYNPNGDFGFGCLDVNHQEHYPYFNGQHHCYLYHQLYDHSYLSWRDLLRIKCWWVEFEIAEQCWKSE